jgi:6-pyruvoyltetrahydropterin/6-carboxytetrahydropterin synthase
MISICKVFTFEAAHFLPFHEGKCKNPHGHSYKLEIEVSGTPKKGEVPDKGMIIDFGKLKEIVNDLIIDHLDHSNLNDNFGNPTAENMVLKFSKILKEGLTGSNCHVTLQRVRLWETTSCYAEWRKS